MVFHAVSLSQLNMNKKFWISLGVILWLYFAVSNLPAVWGAYFLTRGGDIALSGVSGTVWQGRASLASVKVRGIDHSLGQLSWTLQLPSFFTLKPCAAIVTHMDNQDFDGTLCSAGKNAFAIKDAAISFPSSLVQPLVPILIGGQLSLNLEHLTVANGQLVAVRGKATWSDGKIYNGSNWMNLGTLGADLVDDGKHGLEASLFDVNSPLKMAMKANLPYPTGAMIKGNIAMSENYFREINAGAWISMFAVPQANDDQGNLVYTVDLNF